MKLFITLSIFFVLFAVALTVLYKPNLSLHEKFKVHGCYDEQHRFLATDMCCELASERFKRQ